MDIGATALKQRSEATVLTPRLGVTEWKLVTLLN
jgi:hypothetical protein